MDDVTRDGEGGQPLAADDTADDTVDSLKRTTQWTTQRTTKRTTKRTTQCFNVMSRYVIVLS